jgi:hypothetical protein
MKDWPRFSYYFIFKLCFNFLLSIDRFPPPFSFLFPPLCSSSISKPIHTAINSIVKPTHMPFNPRPTLTNTNNTYPLSWDPPTNLSYNSAEHIADIRKCGRNSTIEGWWKHQSLSHEASGSQNQPLEQREVSCLHPSCNVYRSHKSPGTYEIRFCLQNLWISLMKKCRSLDSLIPPSPCSCHTPTRDKNTHLWSSTLMILQPPVARM